MEECPNCNNSFKYLGQHWRQAERCDYPEITAYQHEVITGLLMGDGGIEGRRKGENPRLRCGMTTKVYLDYLDTIVFPVLGSGVRLYRTAEKSAKETVESGFREKSNEKNYSDIYKWGTRSLPELERYAQWYNSGRKVWPSDIQLTPVILKHWYAGDGSYNNERNINIHLSNERKNKEKVEKYFRKQGFEIGNWIERERNQHKGYDTRIVFTVSESERMFEYMGDPLPGFEYKWP